MYTFDTTGNGCDILLGSEIITTVADVETAKQLCDDLNKMAKTIHNATKLMLTGNCPDCGGWMMYTITHVYCTNCGGNGVPKANRFEYE